MPTSIDAADLRGFRVWRGLARVMSRAHIHSDIEINFVLSGEAEYFFAGRFQALREDDLAVFWAGTPHALSRASSNLQMVWSVVPLAWFLQWQPHETATGALLRGEILIQRDTSGLTRALMLRWCEEFGDCKIDAHDEARKIIALEVEALLRRTTRDVKTRGSRRGASTHAADAGSAQIEKMSAFIARHYCDDDLTIREIASDACLHPNYAMHLFRERCGLSLWDYVLRLRVSHAQYLLLSSHRKMSDIARESGFASESRFYAAFEKYAGGAPRAWRSKIAEREA